MGYIGQLPGTKALTASDIADNLITSAKLNYSETTLTDQATITWDASTEDVAKVTLGANRTLGAPSNGTTGQFISLLIIQDGTGSRTLTWNAVYEFASDTAPTLTTTNSLVVIKVLLLEIINIQNKYFIYGLVLKEKL
jgi:hypothetical protein